MASVKAKKDLIKSRFLDELKKLVKNDTRFSFDWKQAEVVGHAKEAVLVRMMNLKKRGVLVYSIRNGKKYIPDLSLYNKISP